MTGSRKPQNGVCRVHEDTGGENPLDAVQSSGSTALVVPSTFPEALLACTATYGSPVRTATVVRGGAGQHLPALDLRGAIPTDVERYLIIGSLLDRHSWVVARVSAPREAECPVRLGFSQETSVEEEFALMGELGEIRRAAPTYEQVGVG